MWKQRKKTKKPGDSDNDFDLTGLENMPDVDDALAEAEALMQEAEREEKRLKEEKAQKEKQEREERSNWGRCRC